MKKLIKVVAKCYLTLAVAMFSWGVVAGMIYGLQHETQDRNRSTSNLNKPFVGDRKTPSADKEEQAVQGGTKTSDRG